MAYISKHHSEQEGKSDYGEQCWTHFLIAWHSIGINYTLEWSYELICSEICWRIEIMLSHIIKLQLWEMHFF